MARPDDHFLHMKHGRALVLSGDLTEATAAYRQAIILKPERPEGHLELGRALRLLGQRDEALHSLSVAVSLSQAYVEARRELIVAGGASLLPETPFASVSDIHPGRFPAEAYAIFREHNPVLPPPTNEGDGQVLSILIDNAASDPAAVRSTLLSLTEQTHPFWTAHVISRPDNANHPVRSLAQVDPRILFTDVKSVRQAAAETIWWLSLSAGTVVDREALAWMAHTVATTSPGGAYADHEVVSTSWKEGRRSLRPALQPMPDPDDLASTPEPPIMTLLPAADLDGLITSGEQYGYSEARAWVLVKAMETGSVAHVPRILSAREDAPPVPRLPLKRIFTSEDNARKLLVIIPTRDGGQLLKTCVDSLINTSSHPERIRFLVVDNGSRGASTLGFLRKLRRRTGADVLTVDEPFNWSRLNNLAVQVQTDADLVFVNDDTEMLTTGWDLRIASQLAQTRIGIVGARLLYPDRTVQHAGIAMGVADGLPIHEGAHVERTDGGPLDRWRRSRSAAAVTGAFIAIRRSVFETVGGFDDLNLAVAYNDIDLCLKVRERGLRVIYDATVELIHHESVSRGRNDNAAKIAWDHGELRSLKERWGEALFCDPARNPHWASNRLAPFDAFFDLSPDAVVRHIGQSVASPWAATRILGR